MNARSLLTGRSRAFIFACLLLALLNAALQAFLQRDHLGDAVDSARSPASTDARDYAGRADLAARGEFGAAFADARRMPGYPLFLAGFEAFTAEPRRAARWTQLLLSACAVAFAGFGLRRALRAGRAPGTEGARGAPGEREAFAAFDGAGRAPERAARLTPVERTALAGAFLVAAWVPLYHFSPLLLPESLSVFALALLLWLLAGFSQSAASLGPPAPGLFARASAARKAAALSFVFALLVYLKPNHVLFAAPVVVFLLAASGARRREGLRQNSREGLCAAALFLAFSAALLAPWSAYASLRSGTFVSLTTVSGYNLYLGAGRVEGEGLHARAARALKLEAAPEPREGAAGAATAAAEDGRYARAARAAWAERPWATATYGLAKILHGFGFSFRGPRDAVLALFACAAFASAFRLRRDAAARPWVLFFWTVTAITLLQMFLYLPNQRFKTLLFDLPALWILALGLLPKTGSDNRREPLAERD